MTPLVLTQTLSTVCYAWSFLNSFVKISAFNLRILRWRNQSTTLSSASLNSAKPWTQCSSPMSKKSSLSTPTACWRSWKGKLIITFLITKMSFLGKHLLFLFLPLDGMPCRLRLAVAVNQVSHPYSTTSPETSPTRTTHFSWLRLRMPYLVILIEITKA